MPKRKWCIGNLSETPNRNITISYRCRDGWLPHEYRGYKPLVFINKIILALFFFVVFCTNLRSQTFIFGIVLKGIEKMLRSGLSPLVFTITMNNPTLRELSNWNVDGLHSLFQEIKKNLFRFAKNHWEIIGWLICNQKDATLNK